MLMRNIFLIGIVLIAALSRLVPHPPNFTPIIAMSLFSGVYFSNKNIAVIVVLLAMFISDTIIGFHSLMIWVYASFVIITFMGSLVKPTIKNLGFATIGSSLFFFLVTNFGVWFSGTFYPKTLSGLFTCYVAGLPFLKNSIAGDLFYIIVLFSLFEFAKRNFFKLTPDNI